MSPANSHSSIVLVAPNVSQFMGGEAIKALGICCELMERGYAVYQVTHERNRAELSQNFPELAITYTRERKIQHLIWKHFGNSPLINVLDVYFIHKDARRIVRETGSQLVHFTSPISTVIPYYSFPEAAVVIGPLNGTISRPPAFSQRQSFRRRFSELLQPTIQRVLGLLFRGKRDAHAILVAGGDRTRRALLRGGVREERLVNTLDSGISNDLLSFERIVHSGRNGRFVYLGRLVEYKACDLLLQAMARTPAWIKLDIIGDGPERGRLEALVIELGLQDRVRMLGWVKSGPALFEALREYRGMVTASLAEANGIAVQEAMMLGLPVIAVNWGGPALLLSGGGGILVDHRSSDAMVAGLAEAMTKLASDGTYADQLARTARDQAEREHFAWNALIGNWVHIYNRVLSQSGRPILQPAPVALRPSGDLASAPVLS